MQLQRTWRGSTRKIEAIAAAVAPTAPFALPGAQSPKATPTLARRLQRERRTRLRLGLTDATIVATSTLLVAVATVPEGATALTPVPLERTLAAPALVVLVWLVALAG